MTSVDLPLLALALAAALVLAALVLAALVLALELLDVPPEEQADNAVASAAISTTPPMDMFLRFDTPLISIAIDGHIYAARPNRLIARSAARSRHDGSGFTRKKAHRPGFWDDRSGRHQPGLDPPECAALHDAGLGIAQVDAVTTHNPFAVNDIYFSRQTGFPVERMNSYGCSLIFRHPQGPTGLRSKAELIEELRLRGGGTGLFTGCAAGDTGAAIVLRVAD
jgi:hypothetical protein